jgi:geranylgeranyl pyrophosphate synthase
MELAREDDKKALLSYYAAPSERVQRIETESDSANEARITQVNEIFQKYGADKMLLDEIRSLTGKALGMIDRLGIEDSGKDLLQEFSHVLMNRKV